MDRPATSRLTKVGAGPPGGGRAGAGAAASTPAGGAGTRRAVEELRRQGDRAPADPAAIGRSGPAGSFTSLEQRAGRRSSAMPSSDLP